MVYILILAIVAMLGYMLWSTSVRLRHDRVKTERERTRGKFTFRPRERIRFLLKRSFDVEKEEAEWEAPLVSSLKNVPAEPGKPQNDVQRT